MPHDVIWPSLCLPTPALRLRRATAPSQPGGGAQDLPGPLTVPGGGKEGAEAPSYPKADLPVDAHLQVEAVGAVPVAVDNVHFAVTVEVCQGDTSPMLVGVVHTWGGRQGPSGQCLCWLQKHSPGWGPTKSNKRG